MSATLCLVIPCYNEATRFPKTEFEAYYQKSSHSFCFVNDGSQDDTLKMLTELQAGRENRILIVNQQPNAGKAEAVRRGAMATTEWKSVDYIGYWDADLATPFEEADYLLSQTLTHPHLKFIVGSRMKRLGAQVERNARRHYFGRIFATCASIILDLPVYDTQCGAKLLASDWVKELFQTPFLSRWLFDVEIFARIMQKFGRTTAEQSIMEVPLRVWIEKGDSRLKASYLIKVPFELWKIYRKYRNV